MIVGIDLGTTNSLVGAYGETGPILFTNSAGHHLTPSAVSIDEGGGVIVGARDRRSPMPIAASPLSSVGGAARGRPWATRRSTASASMCRSPRRWPTKPMRWSTSAIARAPSPCAELLTRFKSATSDEMKRLKEVALSIEVDYGVPPPDPTPSPPAGGPRNPGDTAR